MEKNKEMTIIAVFSFCKYIVFPDKVDWIKTLPTHTEHEQTFLWYLHCDSCLPLSQGHKKMSSHEESHLLNKPFI